MAILICLAFLLCLSSCAADQPYFRYWSGYRLDNQTTSSFASGLDWFLNQTVSISVCGGLKTYIVPLMNSSASKWPDEIALLQYESEAEYHKFYSTPLGKFYQSLHAQYFNMSLSHSLVPETFASFQNVSIDSAYCIPNCDVNWNDFSASHSVFGFGEQNPLFVIPQLVKPLINIPGFKATVFGVYDNYIKMTNFWSNLQGSKKYVQILETLSVQPIGGPFEQIAQNVSPPLKIEYGNTYNVTIDSCLFR